MQKLFIIDQSLTDVGGHHFDYTRLIAQAAWQRGIQPVIGTHRMLKPEAEQTLRQFGSVHKIFRETTYTYLSQLAGLKELSHRGVRSRWTQLSPGPQNGRFYNFWAKRSRNHRMRQRARKIHRFAEDCRNFFGQFTFEDEDHVFFTTLSELEFMGLTAFMGSHPESLSATWHTQFHFSLFAGRPDNFDDQTRQENLLRGAFQTALSRAPYHDIRGYATSQELVQQYNRMQVLAFQALPYPVNPELCFNLLQEPALRPAGPLKMTVAGGVRREKGQKTRVSQLINAIWDSQIATGRVQLDIQASEPRQFSCHQVMQPRQVDPELYRQRVRVLPHPLPEAEYVNLIRESDIGLFCYDSARYHSRRAGILCEFLACGKPVMVPAGSWLSRQIQEPVFQHIESMAERASRVERMRATDLSWSPANAPLSGRAISFNGVHNPFRCEFRRQDLSLSEAKGIIVAFHWPWVGQGGSHVDLELNCFDEHNQPLSRDRQIVGIRPQQRESLAYLSIPQGFATGKLTFRNAFTAASIILQDIQIRFLDFAQPTVPPRSAVGVIAADTAMMTQAVDELVQHYDHYLESAVRFSHRWAAWHDPGRTVDFLIPGTRQKCHAA